MMTTKDLYDEAFCYGWRKGWRAGWPEGWAEGWNEGWHKGRVEFFKNTLDFLKRIKISEENLAKFKALFSDIKE